MGPFFFHSPTKKAQFSGQKPLRGSIKLDNYPERNCTAETIALQPSISQGCSRGEEQKLNTRGVLTRSHMPTQHRCVSGACPRDFRESQCMRRQSAAVSPKYCTTKTWWLGNPEAENWRTGRVQVATPPVTEVCSSHGNNTLQAGVGMYVGA